MTLEKELICHICAYHDIFLYNINIKEIEIYQTTLTHFYHGILSI